MKVELGIPVRNSRGDKRFTFELDTDTSRVTVTPPIKWRGWPEINLDDLARVVDELKAVQGDALRR